MKYKWTLSGGFLEQRNTGVKCRNKFANYFGIEGFTKKLLNSNIILKPVHWNPLKETCSVRSRGNACMHTYTHNTYVRTCIHAYIHTYMLIFKLTYKHTYINTYMHTYTHADVLAYVTHQVCVRVCVRARPNVCRLFARLHMKTTTCAIFLAVKSNWTSWYVLCGGIPVS
jgi:hypothetical protein